MAMKEWLYTPQSFGCSLVLHSGAIIRGDRTPKQGMESAYFKLPTASANIPL